MLCEISILMDDIAQVLVLYHLCFSAMLIEGIILSGHHLVKISLLPEKIYAMVKASHCVLFVNTETIQCYFMP